jgi:hypothetical protein
MAALTASQTAMTGARLWPRLPRFSARAAAGRDQEPPITIKTGDTLNLDTIAARLVAFGYSREEQVNLPGSFAARGDILDVFPSDADTPYRVDLFGDDVETIRPFDRETQRSFGRVDSITLVPAHEVAFTRETMASASAKLRQIADKRVAEMQAAGADPERIERPARFGGGGHFADRARGVLCGHRAVHDAAAPRRGLRARLSARRRPARSGRTSPDAGPRRARHRTGRNQPARPGRARRDRALDGPAVPNLRGGRQERVQKPANGDAVAAGPFAAVFAPEVEAHLRGVPAQGFGGRRARLPTRSRRICKTTCASPSSACRRRAFAA